MKVRDYDSPTYNRARTAKLHAKRDRDIDRTQLPVCTCRWITAFEICPMCGGERVESQS